MRTMKWMAVLAVVVLVAVACGRGTPRTQGGGGGRGAVPRGGTLHLGMTGDVDAAFDPQKAYYSPEWELLVCCVSRTLLAYNGKAAEQGGNTLFPDLAVDLPEVSPDGLTYTFEIKPGIMYAPPLDDIEVTSHDFVRALEREADPEASAGAYPFYYSIIKGFDEFSKGKADTIEGVEAVDDHALRITLNAPAGELLNLMAMPAMAPIPPNPDEPDARLGIAEGHTADFGRFQVGTAPYMFEGTEKLDFSVPAKEQKPVSGYQPGRSIVLVRNPSWKAETDSLRPAYVDRIEIEIGGTEQDLANKVERGELDFIFDSPASAEQIAKYSQDPALQGRLFSNPDDGVAYVSINIAEPPFDDIHVRKAANYVVNRDAMLRVAGGPLQGEVASHIMPPSLIGNLNADYDPYASPGSRGDVAKAKEEMKQSKYDSNGDGICDDPACENVLAVSEEEESSQNRVEIIADGLAQIGITVDNRPLEIGPMYSKCEDPNAHVALCMSAGWGKDFPDGITFGPPLFGTEALHPACCNYALVGASPEYLRKAGYETTEVASADAVMDECALTTGNERNQCWADVDRYISENIVPWITVRFTKFPVAVSARVVNYTFNQFTGEPSLTHIGVRDTAA